jgi:hypothetical protein
LTDQAIDEATRSSLLKAVIEAIVEGRVPDNLTVTGLVRNLPAEWADQESRFRLLKADIGTTANGKARTKCNPGS